MLAWVPPLADDNCFGNVEMLVIQYLLYRYHETFIQWRSYKYGTWNKLRFARGDVRQMLQVGSVLVQYIESCNCSHICWTEVIE